MVCSFGNYRNISYLDCVYHPYRDELPVDYSKLENDAANGESPETGHCSTLRIVWVKITKSLKCGNFVRCVWLGVRMRFRCVRTRIAFSGGVK